MLPLIILGGLGLLGAALIAFWPQIIHWVRGSVLPWIQRNFPQWTKLFETALVAVDNAVVAVRNAAKAAWAQIKPRILSMTQEFKKLSPTTFEGETITYLKKEEEKAERITTTETLSYDDLPSDIREKLCHTGQKMRVDVKKEHEKMLLAH